MGSAISYGRQHFLPRKIVDVINEDWIASSRTSRTHAGNNEEFASRTMLADHAVVRIKQLLLVRDTTKNTSRISLRMLTAEDAYICLSFTKIRAPKKRQIEDNIYLDGHDPLAFRKDDMVSHTFGHFVQYKSCTDKRVQHLI